jgi:hypothetical protein
MSNFQSGLDMSAEDFAAFGGKEVAYVRPVRCEEAASLYPKMPYHAPWFTLFTLHAADGSLIGILDSLEEAVEDAASRQLQAVALH